MPQELRWGTATAWERVSLVAMWVVGWGIVFPAMAFGGIMLIGTIIDVAAQRADELRRCQKHAATPYEYHQCR